MFDTVAIVGLGLLGGSLGMALRSRKLARRVVALVRREATLDEGHRMGALDEGSLEPAVVAGAELIVLAPPVQQIAPLARNIAPFLDAGALVTDVGSTKAALAREIPTLLPAGREFLGGHPMAGSELTGVLHAREDLFEHTVYLLT
ncbi:MAG: prephenate dehydrogenase/arogenate dehydrogenase family protein, partial [Armatimonadetes bacterium]|nr:prephenate dehydrogenase/arogenate dehydrogenase family protein [Armatimonadota bacterium]